MIPTPKQVRDTHAQRRAKLVVALAQQVTDHLEQTIPDDRTWKFRVPPFTETSVVDSVIEMLRASGWEVTEAGAHGGTDKLIIKEPA